MIQSLLRSLEILEYLCGEKREYSLQEIAGACDLAPSTTHRILQTYCSRGYVVRDAQTHLYKIGPAMIQLGVAAVRHLELREASLPVLGKLSCQTKEDAYLMVIHGSKGVILEKVEGPNYLKVADRFGYEFDLHCGANRKTLLAFQSDEFIENYISRGLRAYTDQTVQTPEELWAQIRQIRRDWVCISSGEYIPEAVGIGAPVFDRDNNAVATIGIIAPESRMDPANQEQCKRAVMEAGTELSHLLGWVDTRRH